MLYYNHSARGTRIVPQFRGEGREGTESNQQSDERQCAVETGRQVKNEMPFECEKNFGIVTEQDPDDYWRSLMSYSPRGISVRTLFFIRIESQCRLWGLWVIKTSKESS